MQVTLLGTGLPYPNPKRRGPGYLVRAGSHNFVVDCGSGIVHRMVEAGVMPNEVDHLFITHLHSDHYIDLGHFMICHWIYGDDRPWHVYGPDGIGLMIAQLLEMHRPDLELRMKIRKAPREMPNIVVHELSQGTAAEVDGVKVTAFDVQHQPLDQPFGYHFETKDRRIVLSGDTCPCENLIKHAHGADVLIHECVQYDKWTSKQIDESHTPHAHTSPDRLALVAKDAKVGMLITTHMLPNSEPRELSEIIRRDYAGPLAIGEDLMTV